MDTPKRKIKIIHVLTDSNIGGAGTLLINYLHCFDKDKYDISVCLPDGAALIPLVEAEGYRVIPYYSEKDKSFSRDCTREFIKLFKKEKPDIVHTHSSFSAKYAAFRAHVKSRIYTRHCAFEMPRKLTTFPGKQINGFINNTLATEIIAVAGAAKDNLVETGVSEKKITVIINGVMPVRKVSDEEKEDLRNRLGIGKETFVMGIPARLEAYKGHSFLLDTVKELSEKRDNFVVLIMGEGSERENLEEKARNLEIGDKVIFTGFVSDLAPYYNIMDLNINCSYGTETSSLSLSEGMSLSVPAVATTFGGNPYMITEGVNGLLVPPKDPEAMTKAIVSIMDDKALYDKLCEGALRMYFEKFTAESMTRQLEEIYDREAKRIGI